MTIVETLKAAGFSVVEDLGSKNGKTLVKVMTSKGWAYERFSSADEAAAWAKGYKP